MIVYYGIALLVTVIIAALVLRIAMPRFFYDANGVFDRENRIVSWSDVTKIALAFKGKTSTYSIRSSLSWSV